MWRNFKKPVLHIPLDQLREAVSKALPRVLEETGANKTNLSKEVFNCGSTLQRFLQGGALGPRRALLLIEKFDEVLGFSESQLQDSREQEPQDAP